jgi:hypothetical protein
MSELKLKYKFDTQNPHDLYEYQNLVNAHKYRSLLSEIFREFRKRSKYGHSSKGTWQEAYEFLWELATDEDMNPWEDIF